MKEKEKYYIDIRNELINNEIYKKVKDYSKNKNELETYYRVGKLLFDAGKHYGEGIIKEYSINLTEELGKGYSTSNLKRMRQFYCVIEKGVAMPHQLSWSHIISLLPLENINKINYYIYISIKSNLAYRELRKRIKLNEYERLDENIKKFNQDKTIGIIICRENNEYVIKYSSDSRIYETTYMVN